MSKLTEAQTRENRIRCIKALRKTQIPKVCGSFISRHWGAYGPDGPVTGCCALPVFAEALGIIPSVDAFGDNMASPFIADGVSAAIDFDEGRVYVISDSTADWEKAANVFCAVWDISQWDTFDDITENA